MEENKEKRGKGKMEGNRKKGSRAGIERKGKIKEKRKTDKQTYTQQSHI